MPRGKHRRRAAREQAFQILYGLSFSPAETEADVRHAYWQSPDNSQPGQDDDSEPAGFAWELLLGVWRKAAMLDAVIDRYSHNWRVERIGRIELTLLRLGLYEMLCREDVPPRVVINEALELAAQFGGHNARPFVNGILDSVARARANGEDVLAAAGQGAR